MPSVSLGWLKQMTYPVVLSEANEKRSMEVRIMGHTHEFHPGDQRLAYLKSRFNNHDPKPDVLSLN